jgi:hypothetical protein
MKYLILFFFTILISASNLNAQNFKVVRIKAGTRAVDYFPLKDRYRYKDFIPGKVVFKSGKTNDLKLNYNFLFGEIEFIQSTDTLYISKKKDIRYVVAQDTFFFDGGYIEYISRGPVKVGLRQYVKLKEVLEEGAFGTTNRASSVDTYSSMSSNGISYDLVPLQDIEVQMTVEFYLRNPNGGFIMFNKKNVLQLYPEHTDKIKAFIKSNKVDFESRNDLLDFADFLGGL